MRKNQNPMPFSYFEWKIAGRYLKSKKKDGVISIIAIFSLIGIILGVATLIIVLAVMNGFRSELLDKILGINGHITVQAYNGKLYDYHDYSNSIASLPGISNSIPIIDSQVMISSGDITNGALIKGVTREGILSIKKISQNIKLGSLDNFNNNEVIIIGTRMAINMGVNVGDLLTLISPKGAQTPFGTTPRVKSYEIIALFEIGMSEYDGNIIYMPMFEAQRYFNKKDAVSGIEIFLDNPDEAENYQQTIENITNNNYYVSSWKQKNSAFFTALEVERDLMFIIVSLIVLVAGLNIISGLIMLVKDKTSDIAILRTMGASRKSIMRIFFITGAFIGITGTFIGVVVGILFCNNIDFIRLLISSITGTDLFSPEMYYLTKLPAEINISELISVIIMSLSFSVIATLYPSYRASKVDPVVALRYE
ncbi:MAG: lipoprotein-releasing ABC transporter permease subunit [Alphaproteobacteria bacterium]|jgi:lipoprotein-releasing system permease protein|tara:strand:+ start:29719 stop:30987 length:1269 start_codon:yes stop_codon:yes gene_type:complete